MDTETDMDTYANMNTDTIPNLSLCRRQVKRTQLSRTDRSPVIETRRGA